MEFYLCAINRFLFILKHCLRYSQSSSLFSCLLLLCCFFPLPFLWSVLFAAQEKNAHFILRLTVEEKEWSCCRAGKDQEYVTCSRGFIVSTQQCNVQTHSWDTANCRKEKARWVWLQNIRMHLSVYLEDGACTFVPSFYKSNLPPCTFEKIWALELCAAAEFRHANAVRRFQ